MATKRTPKKKSLLALINNAIWTKFGDRNETLFQIKGDYCNLPHTSVGMIGRKVTNCELCKRLTYSHSNKLEPSLKNETHNNLWNTEIQTGPLITTI